MTEFTLYSMPSSGNSYKVRLLMALLGKSYTHIACEANSAELAAAKSDGNAPLGKVPALKLADGTILSESNAILWYLGAGTDWVPETVREQADMLSWMFFEQNRHEGVIAVRAALLSYPHRAAEATPDRMAALLASGNEILSLMETALTGKDWFTGTKPSLADIALYAYTHTAGTRGGYDMSQFPNINAWCDRMAALDGYVGLHDIP